MNRPSRFASDAEFTEWRDMNDRKSKAASRKRYRWGKKIGLPGYEKPPPGEIDWDAEDDE